MAHSDAETALERLVPIITTPAPSAVAVSGGVDSMTLAVVAGRHTDDVVMIHATSPAVPPEATARVKRYAQREGWTLEILDAGEFGDARYRANPVNRCYFCKTNLYGAMAAVTERELWSGTNTDDLGDYRPGLVAAQEHAVEHPYVEAGIDKQMVRAIARYMQLHDLAELPAAPCLSSRVQTGIAIDARDLSALHTCEKLVAERLARFLTPNGAQGNARGTVAGTVRCRVRDDGIVIELDELSLCALADGVRSELASEISTHFAGHRPGIAVRFAPYTMGSAFVHAPQLQRSELS